MVAGKKKRDEWMTLLDAAAAIGKHPNTVRAHRRKFRVREGKRKALLIERESFLAWAKARY